jgi:copper chaperone CopZ
MTCGGCSGAIERVLKKAQEKDEGALRARTRSETDSSAAGGTRQGLNSVR